jgi:hypothetical protein
MSVRHLRCRRDGPHSFTADGFLADDGVRHGPVRVEVEPDGSWRCTPGGGDDRAVRFPGLVVAPALADGHVHLHPGVDPCEYLRFGVCRVRDLGSRTEDAPGPAGCDRPLPEVVRGGPMLDRPGRRRLLIAAEWSGAEQLPALLDSAVDGGASWLKLYEGFPAELFGPAVALAHQRGLRVAVHPAPGDYRAALAAGVDELEHLACLIPAGAAGTHAALARWAGWSPGEGWPVLPPGTAVCPTLLAPSALVEHARRGWAFEGHDPAMAEFWRGAAIAREPWTPGQLADGDRAVAAMRTAVGALDRAGVRWVVGSDTPNPGLRPGESLWREMDELVAAGLAGSRVFRMAAVAPSVARTGSHPLLLLPPDACGAGPFPTGPPRAVLHRGCLYTPHGGQS